jgi:hypothetical protein
MWHPMRYVLKIGISQVSMGQRCAREVSIAQVGLLQIATLQIARQQKRFRQVNTGQVRLRLAVSHDLPGQTPFGIDAGGTIKLDERQAHSRQVRPRQVSILKFGEVNHCPSRNPFIGASSVR